MVLCDCGMESLSAAAYRVEDCFMDVYGLSMRIDGVGTHRVSGPRAALKTRTFRL